jgi:hypothetical protein
MVRQLHWYGHGCQYLDIEINITLRICLGKSKVRKFTSVLYHPQILTVSTLPKTYTAHNALKSNKLAITEDRHPTCIHNQIIKNYISNPSSSHSYTETIKQQEQNSKCNLTSTAFSEALWNASEIIVGCSPLPSKFRHCFSKAPAKTTTATPKQHSDIIQNHARPLIVQCTQPSNHKWTWIHNCKTF